MHYVVYQAEHVHSGLPTGSFPIVYISCDLLWDCVSLRFGGCKRRYSQKIGASYHGFEPLTLVSTY
jgi:hypothetical protein